jgi:hypothetical protein
LDQLVRLGIHITLLANSRNKDRVNLSLNLKNPNVSLTQKKLDFASDSRLRAFFGKFGMGLNLTVRYRSRNWTHLKEFVFTPRCTVCFLYSDIILAPGTINFHPSGTILARETSDIPASQILN